MKRLLLFFILCPLLSFAQISQNGTDISNNTIDSTSKVLVLSKNNSDVVVPQQKKLKYILKIQVKM